nr:hypothetical protein [uncultured Enterobacter sp.]
MAWTTGTAADECDLLAKIDEFLTSAPELNGEHWTRIYHGMSDATNLSAAVASYAWQGQGSSGADQVYVTARTANKISDDTYNLMFCGGTYFNPIAVINPDNIHTGLINASHEVGLCAERVAFTYWIIATGRRFIVIVQLSNAIYSSAYCGLMLPAVPPMEYPYPLVIAGSTDAQLRRYSVATDYNTSIADPRALNFWLLYPDQGWRDFCGSKAESITTGGGGRYVWPTGAERYKYGKGVSTMLQSLIGAPGSDNPRPLLAIELRAMEDSGNNFFGALDGVYWLPAVGGLTAGDTITTIDDKCFLVVRNAWRTGTSDYFAVELI